MEQSIQENEMTTEDHLNLTETRSGNGGEGRTSQENGTQWPTIITPLPKRTPNLRAVRQRKPAAALKSPFRPNDKRGDDLAKYMRAKNAGK